MYALTGLVPEYVSFDDFHKEGLPLLRSLLTDEMYFGNKAFVTCYCDDSFRPKLPSVIAMLKEKQNTISASDLESTLPMGVESQKSSPSKLLSRLQ